MATQDQQSGLTMPTPFPDVLFEAVKDRIIAKILNPSPQLDNLLGGHNGVRYRLRACADYSEEFIERVRHTGGAPPQAARYQQERVLFGFFVSGIAALDSFNFFIYFTAAHLRPNRFPTNNPSNIRAIARKSTAEAFDREFPGEVITIALKNLDKDERLIEWSGFRNVLAHRAAPGRVVYFSSGTSSPNPAPEWKIDPGGNLKIDENLTSPRLEWLITTLVDLVEAVDQFTQKHF